MIMDAGFAADGADLPENRNSRKVLTETVSYMYFAVKIEELKLKFITQKG